jgi:hypothetical protein
MDAGTALNQLAQAKAAADAQLATDIGDAVGAYVQAAEANARASRAWFTDVANDDLATAAGQAWQQMTQARQALAQALNAAKAKRAQALSDAWTAVKTAN